MFILSHSNIARNLSKTTICKRFGLTYLFTIKNLVLQPIYHSSKLTLSPHVPYCRSHTLQDTNYQQESGGTQVLLSAKEAISLWLLGARKVCSKTVKTNTTITTFSINLAITAVLEVIRPEMFSILVFIPLLSGLCRLRREPWQSLLPCGDLFLACFYHCIVHLTIFGWYAMVYFSVTIEGISLCFIISSCLPV